VTSDPFHQSQSVFFSHGNIREYDIGLENEIGEISFRRATGDFDVVTFSLQPLSSHEGHILVIINDEDLELLHFVILLSFRRKITAMR
jgi:hypothetical protein